MGIQSTTSRAPFPAKFRIIATVLAVVGMVAWFVVPASSSGPSLQRFAGPGEQLVDVMPNGHWWWAQGNSKPKGRTVEVARHGWTDGTRTARVGSKPFAAAAAGETFVGVVDMDSDVRFRAELRFYGGWENDIRSTVTTAPMVQGPADHSIVRGRAPGGTRYVSLRILLDDVDYGERHRIGWVKLARVEASDQAKADTTTTTAPTTTTPPTTNPPTTVPPTTAPPPTTPPTTAPPLTTPPPEPPTTPPPPAPGDGAAFSEDFAAANSQSRFDVGIHHRDDYVVKQSSWPGDHAAGANGACSAPEEKRRIERGSRSSGFNQDWIYRCAPGGDPAKAHMMTSIGDTSGYSIGSFSPKPTFHDVNEVRWDVNITHLGTRQFTEVKIIPAGRLDFQNLPCAVEWLPCDTTTHRQLGSVGTSFFNHEMHIHNGSSDAHKGVRWGVTSNTHDPAVDSIRERRTHYFRDNGNGTLTFGIERADGSFDTYTRSGSFPKGPVRVVFADHNYTPTKDNPGVTFTWHWDDIEVHDASSGRTAQLVSTTVGRGGATGVLAAASADTTSYCALPRRTRTA